MTDDKAQVEGWAIVDLMGHLRMGGYVSEVDFGGSRVGRIDVPAEGEEPASTHLFGGQSIYRLTFVTEEMARLVARRNPVRPIEEWDFRQDAKKRLEASALEDLQRDARRELVQEQREKEAIRTALERIAERASQYDGQEPSDVLSLVSQLAERELQMAGSRQATIYSDPDDQGDVDDEDSDEIRGLPF
jgi:hypothetical protein